MSKAIDRAAFLVRLGEARREIYGDDGIPKLAEAMGIPPMTWANYELGVRLPDTIILEFLCLTGASPLWLLSGEGPRYSAQSRPIVTHG